MKPRSEWLKVVLARGLEFKVVHGFLQSTTGRMLNAMTKVTFLLFCYLFEKIVSEYLHVTSQKNVLNFFFIIEILTFCSNNKFHFCDGKLLRVLKIPC